METFTFLDGPRQGQVGTGLGNYNSDGTVIGTEGGSIAFDPPPKNPHDPQTGLLFSDDVGSWQQKELEPNTFLYTTYNNAAILGRRSMQCVSRSQR